MKLTLKANSKINLLLDITGIKKNGYHKLFTIMQSISLGDIITVEKIDGEEITISCDTEGVPTDKRNIVYKCAEKFFEYADIKENNGIHIHIEKHTPFCAGMGGGSADGAAVLCALNKLCESNLSCEELCDIGFKIGADIPFCIKGGTQRVQGAGEIMNPVPKLNDNLFVLIAKPHFSVSTKLAFQGFDEQIQPQRADVAGMIAALEAGNLDEITAKLGNVFEPFCSLEKISAIKEIMLEQGAKGALMSGSGSAVFALFEEKEKAEACAETLRPQMEQVDVVQPLSKGIYELCE